MSIQDTDPEMRGGHEEGLRLRLALRFNVRVRRSLPTMMPSSARLLAAQTPQEVYLTRVLFAVLA